MLIEYGVRSSKRKAVIVNTNGHVNWTAKFLVFNSSYSNCLDKIVAWAQAGDLCLYGLKEVL